VELFTFKNDMNDFNNAREAKVAYGMHKTKDKHPLKIVIAWKFSINEIVEIFALL